MIRSALDDLLSQWDQTHGVAEHGRMEIDIYPDSIVATFAPSFRVKTVLARGVDNAKQNV